MLSSCHVSFSHAMVDFTAITYTYLPLSSQQVRRWDAPGTKKTGFAPGPLAFPGVMLSPKPWRDAASPPRNDPGGTTVTIRKIASKLGWLGRVHAVDEAEAMAKALPNTASPHNASSPKPLSMVYRKALVLFADRHQGHLCLCSRRRTQCCCSECRSE